MAIHPPLPPDDRAGVTLPSSGPSDSVPAWLSNGEFVVRIVDAGGV